MNEDDCMITQKLKKSKVVIRRFEIAVQVHVQMTSE